MGTLAQCFLPLERWAMAVVSNSNQRQSLLPGRRETACKSPQSLANIVFFWFTTQNYFPFFCCPGILCIIRNVKFWSKEGHCLIRKFYVGISSGKNEGEDWPTGERKRGARGAFADCLPWAKGRMGNCCHTHLEPLKNLGQTYWHGWCHVPYT